MPKEAQALIVASLKNHPQVELFTYPGRDHAFAAQGRRALRRRRTRRSPKTRTLELFKKALELMLAIQAVRAGGPEVLEAVDAPNARRRARARCWCATRRSGSTSSTPISAAASIRCATRRCSARKRPGVVEALGEGVDRLQGRRPGGLQRPGRRLRRVPGGRRRRAPLHLPDGVGFEVAGGVIAEGHDHRVPAAALLSAESRRDHPGRTRPPAGSGRCWCSGPRRSAPPSSAQSVLPPRPRWPRELGCDHVILYRDEDVAARVREITGGAGVPGRL